MFINIILIILGFALLIKGADFLVDGASNIAKKFNISSIIIGSTIVAVGTSMPELVVSTSSAIKGYSDIAIGNVVGSNLSNLFLILGVCAIIKPLKYDRNVKKYTNPIAVISTLLLLILCNTGNVVTKIEGIILLIGCLLFILYNIKLTQTSSNEDTNIKKISLSKSIICIIIGMIGLKFGGDFVVDNSVILAKSIGISEKLVSLTVVAFSTSLPELITSITATIKGDTDLAIGNVLGSQIFNILLIIGLSAFFSPINYDSSFNLEIILLQIGTILMTLFPFIGKKNYMTRINGILFTAIYIIYGLLLIISNL